MAPYFCSDPASSKQKTKNNLKSHFFEWIKICLPLIFILLPIILQGLFISRFAVNVPFWDQWQFIPAIQQFHDGGNWLQAIWRPHDVHRQFFPNLIFLFLASFTDWNTIAEMVFSFIISCLILLIMWLIYRKATSGNLWGFVVVSWLFCSWGQWENMLWGWQVSIYLMVFGVLLTLYLLSFPNRITLILAALTAVLASYSFNTGLYVWPIGLVSLLIKRSSIKRVVFWLMATLITVMIYFIRFDTSPIQSPFEFILNQPDFLTLYFITVIGASLSGLKLIISIVVGLVIFILGYYFLYHKWFLYKQTRMLSERDLLPINLFLFSLISSIFITLGRIGFEQYTWAMSSRYTTITMVGVVAVYLWVWQHFEENPLLKSPKYILYGYLTIMGLGITLSYLKGYELGKHRYSILKRGQFVTQTWPMQPDRELEQIYFSADILRQKFIPYAQQAQLTAFSEIPDILLDTHLDKGEVLPELLPGQPIIQEFNCPVSTLYDLGLSFAYYDRVNHSDILLELTELDGTIIWQQQYPTSSIRDVSYHYFSLPQPIKSCWGHPLRLKIHSLDGSLGNTISLRIHPSYYQGKLLAAPTEELDNKTIELEINALHFGLNK